MSSVPDPMAVHSAVVLLLDHRNGTRIARAKGPRMVWRRARVPRLSPGRAPPALLSSDLSTDRYIAVLPGKMFAVGDLPVVPRRMPAIGD